MTQPVKPGDTISVHYTGKFDDGEVFDTSNGRDPLKFTVGAGQLIKGFDDAVVGMNKGDKKTVSIEPQDGYGERQDDYIVSMPKDSVPEDMDLKTGMAVQLTDQNGNPVPAIVIEIGDSEVKLDANHPLAGKRLTFEIEIAETGLEPDPDCSSGCSSCGGSCG